MDSRFKLVHKKQGSYYVDTGQVTHVPDGVYFLSAKITSTGSHKANRLYANGDECIEVGLPSSPNVFQEVRIDNIRIQNGCLVVGFYIDTYGGGWAACDDVKLIKCADDGAYPQ